MPSLHDFWTSCRSRRLEQFVSTRVGPTVVNLLKGAT